MKHLIQYNSKVETLFFDYLRDILSLESLIAGLQLLEAHYEMNNKPIKGGELWFKLYKGDTMAYSIADLERSLNPLHNSLYNIKNTKQAMEIGTSLANSVEIYYS